MPRAPWPSEKTLVLIFHRLITPAEHYEQERLQAKHHEIFKFKTETRVSHIQDDQYILGECLAGDPTGTDSRRLIELSTTPKERHIGCVHPICLSFAL